MLAGAVVFRRGDCAKGSASEMAPSRGSQQESLVPHCMDLSVGLLQCVLMTRQITFPRPGDPREKDRSHNVSMFQPQKSHCLILFVRSELLRPVHTQGERN